LIAENPDERGAIESQQSVWILHRTQVHAVGPRRDLGSSLVWDALEDVFPT
jgi:hypothetical protein